MKECPGAWIAMIGGLFAVQTWVVPLIVNEVTGTEWLKGTPEQGGSNIPVSNDQTQQAFLSCNRHLETREPSARLSFPASPDKSWDVGFGRYMVRASVETIRHDDSPQRRDYLCHVRFAGGEMSDPGNWSVDGLEFSQP
jgi:hypothetical protein